MSSQGIFFFFNDTATTEIYTLSLHDALPISLGEMRVGMEDGVERILPALVGQALLGDRKSTRLNSSHANISYAVFCLKKKIRNDSTLPASGTRDKPPREDTSTSTTPCKACEA